MTMNTVTPAPAQLQMIWPRRLSVAPSAPVLPTGYALRTFRKGDQAAYVRLMRRAGFETWSEDKAQGVLSTMHQDGLFFVVHEASGDLAATAAAQSRPNAWHPTGGELGWVGGDPEHRGKGLGAVVCAAATRRLLAADHGSLYLQTDDHRLPAIRIYLRLGWVPFLYHPDMAGRWFDVCAALGVPFESLPCTTDPAGNVLRAPHL